MSDETEIADVIDHHLDVSAIKPEGFDFTIVLDASERARIAEALDVLSVEQVTATGHVWPLDTGATLNFHLEGHVTQACVVSLEPVGCHVDEQVSLHYMPQTSAPAEPQVIDVTDDDDPPEPLIDDRVNVGAAIVEHLALGLDPWPRRDDVEMPGRFDAEQDTSDRQNPFAVLAKLKTELKS